MHDSATTATSGPRPWWVAVVASMASYLDAAAITAFSTVLVIYAQLLGLSDAQVGIVAGLLALGIAVGAFLGGPQYFYGVLAVTSAIGVGTAWLVFRTRDAHDEFAVESRPLEDAAPVIAH